MSDILSVFRLFIYDEYTFWLKLCDIDKENDSKPYIPGYNSHSQKKYLSDSAIWKYPSKPLPAIAACWGFVCCTAQRVVKSRGLHFKSLQHARNAEVADEVEAEAD